MNQEQTVPHKSIPLVLNVVFASCEYDLFMKEVYDWQAFLAAWHRGERVGIHESIYWYFLEVLPPVAMRSNVELVTGDRIVACNFCFAEGAERITAFWTICETDKVRHFLQYTTQVSRG